MEVLFTFLAERYERRSVTITSNLVFSQWDRVFNDAMTTAAAIDRLVHHSIIPELTALPRPPHKYLWSDLMRRVFGLDVLRCDVCGAKRRLVSLTMERSVIMRTHLGLQTEPPFVQHARAPPQLELAFQ